MNQAPTATRTQPRTATRLDHDVDKIPFCGATTRSPMPANYRKIADLEHGAHGEDVPTFVEAIEWLHEHYRQERRPVAYWDEQKEQWVESQKHVALVNPAWEGDGLSEYADAVTHTSVPGDACWYIPTGAYGIVNPLNAYGPLLTMLKRHDAGDVFGHIERYRNTGEVSIDIYMPSFSVKDAASADDRYYLGVNTGYSFYGDKKHYAHLIAYDTQTKSVLRNLSEKRDRRHVRQKQDETAARDVALWWDSTIERVSIASEVLFGVIAEARNYVFEFSESSFDARTLYESMGVPDGHIDDAFAHLPADVTKADAYTLFEALNRVYTDDYTGKVTGSTLKGHVHRANKLLYTPPQVHAGALNHVEAELRGQDTLDGDREAQLAALATEREHALQSVKHFQDARTRLRTLLTEADTSSPDEGDADGGDGE